MEEPAADIYCHILDCVQRSPGVVDAFDAGGIVRQYD
jgi:hypothetical protein